MGTFACRFSVSDPEGIVDTLARALDLMMFSKFVAFAFFLPCVLDTLAVEFLLVKLVLLCCVLESTAIAFQLPCPCAIPVGLAGVRDPAGPG